jgi:anaerobic dimethyl sulfoxide reductase subunit B (iron-sulfur subunit)
MPQLGWRIDLTRCTGCRSCTVACKSENNTGSATYRWVVFQEGGSYPSPTLEFISMACNHCAYPACRKACPVGAISKDPDTGLVVIDSSLCIGCKRCTWACPYGAPQFKEESGKVEKCHGCRQRIAAGLKPACVNACVGRALEFGELSSFGAPSTYPARFTNPKYTIPSIRFIR